MEITARQQSLLRILLEQITPVSAESLGRRLDCSSRTVRYDVEAINSGMRCRLILSGKYGFIINRQLNVAEILGKLQSVSDGKDLGRKLMKSLLDQGQMDLYSFALDNYVSEQWVVNHIKNVLNPKLSQHSLTLSVTRHRIFLTGHESRKREFITERLMAGDKPEDYLAALSRLPEDFEVRLTKMLKDYLRDSRILLDDVFFENLWCILLVCFLRCADGHLLLDDDQSYATGLEIRCDAEEFLKDVQVAFGIAMGAGDLHYICRSISIYARASTEEDMQQRILADTVFCEQIENALIATFRHFDVRVDYGPVLQGLTLHCWYLLARIQAQVWLHSDLTERLRCSSPVVYELSVYMVFLLEKVFDAHIPYEEIGLIAVHLGSLLDISDLGGGAVRVACICSGYGNLQNRLAEQIQKLMGNKIEIVGLFSSFREVAGSSYDFIISAERNENELYDARVVYVGPYLSPIDCLNIERWVLYTLQRRRAHEYSRLLNRFFDEELFFYNEEGRFTADEVLKFLNDKLVKKHYVDERFLPSVIAREKMASTAFFKRFAIPHTLDVAAKETKIAFFYAKEPIEWFGTKVNFVLLLATNGYDETFSKLYESICSIMMNKDLYQQMAQCKTYKQMCEFFRANF